MVTIKIPFSLVGLVNSSNRASIRFAYILAEIVIIRKGSGYNKSAESRVVNHFNCDINRFQTA